MFSDEEKPSILDGIDVAEVLALGMEGQKLAIEESQLPEYKSIQEIPGLDPAMCLTERLWKMEPYVASRWLATRAIPLCICEPVTGRKTDKPS